MEIIYVIGLLIFAISLLALGIGSLLSLRQPRQPQTIRVRIEPVVDDGAPEYDYMADPDYEPVTPIRIERGKPDLKIVR